MNIYKKTAQDCLDNLVEGAKRLGDDLGERAINGAYYTTQFCAFMTEMAINIVPGMLIPSEIREKYYNLEDKLIEKTGFYDDSDNKDLIITARNCGAGALEFLTGIFILPLWDLCARMIFLECPEDYPDFMVDNMSEKYLPTMMPLEFVYCAIKAPIKYVVGAYKKNKEGIDKG